jgi:transposase
VSNATSDRLSRGDRRRNEKLRRLREAVPETNAVLAIDLAQSKQACVVCAPDHRVLARRIFLSSVWGVDQMIDWALAVAAREGLGLTVACEPTGHRWKPVLDRCDRRGLVLVCVQPILVHRSREHEDLTRDRSDPKDATLIARLARDLRCYLPHAPEPDWARLRHLGTRRHAKVADATAARQQLRDLLESSWPAALEAAGRELRSQTLLACLMVTTDPTELARMRYDVFARKVGKAVFRLGGQRRCHRIMRAFYDAATDERTVAWDRAGAAERAAYALEDLLVAQTAVAEVEDRMIGQLAALGYAELAASVSGLSAVGAAAILAETGDPGRYDSARTWVKHAGICPRDNASGRFHGHTTVSKRGRPVLRTAAWRAVWGLLPHNAVFAARYAHLTTRAENPLSDGKARAAIAAALLRQLWVVFNRRVAWDPMLAGAREEVVAAA